MLDLLWIKLEERFKSMAEAFRYFDRNYNNRVCFGEFQKALDHMRIKFQVNTIASLFQALDRDNKGFISYRDFCALAEERRRNIDGYLEEADRFAEEAAAASPKSPDKEGQNKLVREYLAGANI